LANGLIPQINAGLGIALDTNKGLALSATGLGIALITANSGLKLDGGVGINFNIDHFQISSGQLALNTTLATKVTRGTAFAFMTWNNLGNVIAGSAYNCSKTVIGLSSGSGYNTNVINFTTTLPNANYTVIAYCSDGNVDSHGTGSADNNSTMYHMYLGRINIQNKTVNSFAVNSFIEQAHFWDDGSYWNMYPLDNIYNSIVVYN